MPLLGLAGYDGSLSATESPSPLLARIARDLAPWEATGITDAMVDARVARRSAVGDDLWLGARNGTLAVARVKPKGYKGRGHKAYAHLKQALETVRGGVAPRRKHPHER